MSINRLEGLKDDKTGSVIKAIMTGLEFPSYSAPEELLSRVKEQKEIGKNTLLSKRAWLLCLALGFILSMNICILILLYRHFVKLVCRWTAPCKPALFNGLPF